MAFDVCILIWYCRYTVLFCANRINIHLLMDVALVSILNCYGRFEQRRESHSGAREKHSRGAYLGNFFLNFPFLKWRILYIFERRRGPKHCGAREKLLSFPSLDGPGFKNFDWLMDRLAVSVVSGGISSCAGWRAEMTSYMGQCFATVCVRCREVTSLYTSHRLPVDWPSYSH